MVRAVDVSVEAKQFVELFGKASRIDQKLRTALRRNIRNTAKLIAAQVQAEVQKPPEGGLHHAAKLSGTDGGQSALRASIARGVKVQVMTGANSKRVGVYIRATSTGLAGSRKKLVRRWDQGTFRHPVMGTDTWVTQSGRPYFGSTIRQQRGDVSGAVEAAMAEARDWLAGHAGGQSE